MKKQMKIASAIGALAALPAAAAITVVGQTTENNRANNFDFTFDASSADKLVVVVTGEHGFNNNAGALQSLTYDGVPLQEAVYRSAVTANTDTLYHGIWFLDSPATSTGTINVQAATRGTVSAFLLNGTLPGSGASAISGTDTRSVDLTTTAADSMVFASFGVGGAGNTGNTNDIDVDAPLSELSSPKDPSNWQGHVVGNATVGSPGTGSYGFTGGNEAGGFVVAAEFLAVPEPSSTLLLGLAGLGALGIRRRK